MTANGDQIDFTAPAVLKKWPSKNSERATDGFWPDLYSVIDGTLDECMQKLLAMPASQHHLYEIHTYAQGELVTAVMSGNHIREVARLRAFF